MKRTGIAILLLLSLVGCVTTDGQPADQQFSNWLQQMKQKIEETKAQKAEAAKNNSNTKTTTETSTTTSTKNPPVAKGARRLSIQVNLPEDNNFVNAFTTARSAGLQDVILSQDWPDFETGKGEYKPNPNWLEIANSYYPTQNVPLHLMIRPLHTNQKVMPKDLMSKPFDDPEVIDRFNKMLDWALAQVKGSDLVSLSIGSELDIYLQAHPKEWSQYETFLRKTADHARAVRPGLKISAEMTFTGYTGPDREKAISLNRYVDVVGVSYYPTDGMEQKARVPQTVYKDFATMVKIADGKPIIYYQFGYPSGTKCGSSEAQQAQFVRDAFQAWDQYKNEVQLLNFTWMYELSPAAVSGYTKFYHFDNGGFRDFLGSLGYRTWKGGGSDKPSWIALKEEAKARGW